MKSNGINVNISLYHIWKEVSTCTAIEHKSQPTEPNHTWIMECCLIFFFKQYIIHALCMRYKSDACKYAFFAMNCIPTNGIFFQQKKGKQQRRLQIRIHWHQLMANLWLSISAKSVWYIQLKWKAINCSVFYTPLDSFAYLPIFEPHFSCKFCKLYFFCFQIAE